MLRGVIIFPFKKRFCHDEFMIWFCTHSTVWSWLVHGNIWVILMHINDLDMFWVWLILIGDSQFDLWHCLCLKKVFVSLDDYDFSSSNKLYPLLFALLFSSTVPAFVLKSPVIKRLSLDLTFFITLSNLCRKHQNYLDLPLYILVLVHKCSW